MIDGLIQFALRNRLSVFVLAAGLAVGGWVAYTHLTIEAFPDPTDTQVDVVTLYPGQPAEEVERRVAIPLERALNGIAGLFRVRSISLFGLSSVTLTFLDGVDPLVARQQTVERMAEAALPAGVQPSLGPLATPIGEVYRYTLDGATTDPLTLRTLEDWVVRPALLRVPGVADVVSQGGLVKEIHVTPDPVKIAALGVGLNDIFTALSKASDNATGGYLERGQEMFVIRAIGVFKSLADIAAVRVGYHQDVSVALKDVATVSAAYAPRQGVTTRNENHDVVEGIVLMRRGQNPSVVLAALRKRVAELNDHVLPKDVTFVLLFSTFGSVWDAAVILVHVPFAFIGGVLALAVARMTLSVSAAVGFIALLGQAVLNGVLVLAAIQARRTAGASLFDAVIGGARDRLRAVLMTALLASLGLLPAALSHAIGSETQRPIAVVVVGGTISAALLTLVLLPVTYYWATAARLGLAHRLRRPVPAER